MTDVDASISLVQHLLALSCISVFSVPWTELATRHLESPREGLELPTLQSVLGVGIAMTLPAILFVFDPDPPLGAQTQVAACLAALLFCGTGYRLVLIIKRVFS